MKNKIFSVSNEKDSLGFLLWNVTTIWQRQIKNSLKKYKITHPQFVTLASLLWFSIKQEKCNQIKLSNHTKIDKVTLGEVVKILEREKLLERVVDEDDSRSYVLKLTKKGTATASAAIKDVESIDDSFFKKLKKEEKGRIKEYFIKLSVG